MSVSWQLQDSDQDAFRVVGKMVGADRLMNEAIFLGTYPGLGQPKIDYVCSTIQNFVRESLTTA